MDSCVSEPDTGLPGRVIRRTVSKFDGQTICLAPDGVPAFEIGSYIGSGSASVVYEATKVGSHEVCVCVSHVLHIMFARESAGCFLVVCFCERAPSGCIYLAGT